MKINVIKEFIFILLIFTIATDCKSETLDHLNINSVNSIKKDKLKIINHDNKTHITNTKINNEIRKNIKKLKLTSQTQIKNLISNHFENNIKSNSDQKGNRKQNDFFSCSNDCSDKGYCFKGICFCIPGYIGDDCSVSESPIKKACPNDCYRNGNCQDGICSCYSGWGGIDCSSSIFNYLIIIRNMSK